MTHSIHDLRNSLDGISGILVTPFNSDDQIAPVRLKPVVDRAVGAGVHLLVANGNTSEFYALTTAEAEKMVHAAAAHIDGRVPLVGGVGRSIHDACELAKASREAGVSALMVHQPPDPFAAPRGLVSYVRRIRDAGAGLPIVLYLRDDGVGLDTIEELCSIPEVVGVKWASPTPLKLAEAIQRSADRNIAWVGGLAENWAPSFYAVGAKGFTSGLINVFPELSVKIHTALQHGDFAGAMALIRTMAQFESLRAEERNGANVTVVKTALQLMGNDCGAVRAPGAWPLRKEAVEQLQELLNTWRTGEPQRMLR